MWECTGLLRFSTHAKKNHCTKSGFNGWWYWVENHSDRCCRSIVTIGRRSSAWSCSCSSRELLTFVVRSMCWWSTFDQILSWHVKLRPLFVAKPFGFSPSHWICFDEAGRQIVVAVRFRLISWYCCLKKCDLSIHVIWHLSLLNVSAGFSPLVLEFTSRCSHEELGEEKGS